MPVPPPGRVAIALDPMLPVIVTGPPGVSIVEPSAGTPPDGGAIVVAAAAVQRLLLLAVHHQRQHVTLDLALVVQQAAVARVVGEVGADVGQAFHGAVDVLDGQIQMIRAVSNPDELGHLGPVADAWAVTRAASQARRQAPRP